MRDQRRIRQPAKVHRRFRRPQAHVHEPARRVPRDAAGFDDDRPPSRQRIPRPPPPPAIDERADKRDVRPNAHARHADRAHVRHKAAIAAPGEHILEDPAPAAQQRHAEPDPEDVVANENPPARPPRPEHRLLRVEQRGDRCLRRPKATRPPTDPMTLTPPPRVHEQDRITRRDRVRSIVPWPRNAGENPVPQQPAPANMRCSATSAAPADSRRQSARCQSCPCRRNDGQASPSVRIPATRRTAPQNPS